LEQVSQVCVKFNPSGRIYIIFLVEEAESLGQTLEQPMNAVGVDPGDHKARHSPWDGRFLGNPRPLERSLERIRTIHTLSRKEVSLEELV